MSITRNTAQEESRNVSEQDKIEALGIAQAKQEEGMPSGLLELLMGMAMEKPRPNNPLLDSILDNTENNDESGVQDVEFSEQDYKEKEITFTVKVKDLAPPVGDKPKKVGKSTITFKISKGVVSISGNNPAMNMKNPAERTQGVVFSNLVIDFTELLTEELSAREA